MKFRECILHIGTEKTGTTSLRSFLAINREKLLANGIFVPRSLSPYAKLANHERITTFALDIRKVRDDLRIAANVTTEDAVNQHRIAVIEGLEREILSIPTTDHLLLLSNEHCHSRLVELDEVLRLKEFLSRYARKQTVVVYLRPQHELAASLYDQALRAGYYDVPLPPVFGPDVREWVNRKYFDYGDLIKRWTHVFSKEDSPPRAFRDYKGDVRLFSTHEENRALVGSDFEHLHHACSVVYRGAHSDDPSRYDDRQSLTSFTTADGRQIHALVHNEFQGNRRKEVCPSGRYLSCWYNAITYAQ